MIITVMLFVALLANGSPAYAGDPSVIDPLLSMDAQLVQPGQSFDVPINFGTNEAVRTIAFDLTYNPAVVRVDGISEGPFLSSFAQSHGGTTIFSPGNIDNAAGKVAGFGVSLRGADGTGPVGAGVVAVIHFTALPVHGKFTTGLGNIHILDTTGADLVPFTIVTGGLVQVGAGPLLHIVSLTATPSGIGQEIGKTFKVSFTIGNTGGITSDPATATVTANGASPTFQQVPIPPIDPGQSATIEIAGEFTLMGAVNVGDVAEITLAVSGDGSQTITYTYQPVMDIKATNVDANVQPFIQISAPGSIQWSSLALGPNRMDVSLNVRSNTPRFQVSAMDNNPTGWHLTEWDGTAFMNWKLRDPLHIVSLDQGRDVTTGTPAILINGVLADQSVDNGQDFRVSFQQVRHVSDAALPGGRSYHLVLTFTGFIMF
jgi:hypothetical protein